MPDAVAWFLSGCGCSGALALLGWRLQLRAARRPYGWQEAPVVGLGAYRRCSTPACRYVVQGRTQALRWGLLHRWVHRARLRRHRKAL